jgi:UrcA family protein
MNAETTCSRLSEFRSAVRAAGLIALCLAVPMAALAQPSVAEQTSAVKASLADIDLATPEGLAAARERLHEKAREFCFQQVGNLEPAHRADFLSCIDNTLVNELNQVSSGARAAIAAHGSAWPIASENGTTSQLRESVPDTSVITVSIADLDLTTAQGVLIAEKRIHRSARRICSQLLSSQEPTANYTKCVNDATAGALRQIHLAALAAN